MDTPTAVAIVITAVAVLTMLAVGFGYLLRTRRLRARFGPEYERTLRLTGSRTAAERDLLARERHLDGSGSGRADSRGGVGRR
ncbi:hypothetical protein ACWGB8_32210 [Kitasatospora sp. NPDC054939]